jgi:hypothetical protein
VNRRALTVLAALLAVLLSPHLLLLAFTLAVFTVAVLGFGIAAVLVETGGGVCPRGRLRSW